MQCYSTTQQSTTDIITFCKSEWGLGMGTIPGVHELFPVQEFILKAYYGLPLDNGEDRKIAVRDKFDSKSSSMLNEQEFLQWVVSNKRINTTNLSGLRSNLVLAIGQRGGKDTLIAAIVCYELYLLLSLVSPQKYFKVLPFDHLQISLVAPSPVESAGMLGRARGLAARCPLLSMHWDTDANGRVSFFTLSDKMHNTTTGDRKEGTVRIVSSSSWKADSLRGPNTIIGVLNGAAHLDHGDRRRDYAVHEAMTPSLAMFKHPDGKMAGKMLMASIPGKKSGLFYDEYCRSFQEDRNNDLLMLSLPSWIVNPNIPAEFLKAEYERHPDRFQTEYGAQFSD